MEFIWLCYLEPSVISAVLLFLEWDHWLVQATALSPAPEVPWAQTGRSAQDMRQFQQTRQSPWPSEWTCNPKGSYRLDYVSRKTTKKNKQTRQPQKLFPGSPSNSDLVLSDCCCCCCLIPSFGEQIKVVCLFLQHWETQRESLPKGWSHFPFQRFANNTWKGKINLKVLHYIIDLPFHIPYKSISILNSLKVWLSPTPLIPFPAKRHRQ